MRSAATLVTILCLLQDDPFRQALEDLKSESPETREKAQRVLFDLCAPSPAYRETLRKCLESETDPEALARLASIRIDLPDWLPAEFPERGDFISFAASADQGFLLAVTREGHVYRSDDAGKSWRLFYAGRFQQFGKGALNGYIPHISISPHDPSVIFFGTDQWGTFQSKDCGASWSQFNSNTSGWRSNVKIRFHPKDPRILLACTQKDIHRSDDRGATWRAVTPKSSKLHWNDLIFSPDGSEIHGWGSDQADNKGKLFVSRDGGTEWNEVLALAGESPDSILIDGTNLVVLSPRQLWMGTSNQLARVEVPETGQGRYFRSIIKSPAGLLLGTDSGAWVKKEKWEEIHIFSGTSIWHLTRLKETFLAFTSRGVFSSMDGHAWSSRLEGLRGARIRSFVRSENRLQTVYALTLTAAYASNDFGRTWSLIGGNFGHYAPCSLQVDQDGRLFVGSSSTTWARDGESWNKRSEFMWSTYRWLSDQKCYAVRGTHDHSAPDKGLKFAVSTDAGKTLRYTKFPDDIPSLAAIDAQIHVLRKDENRIVLALSTIEATRKVWLLRSKDGGENWEESTGPMGKEPLLAESLDGCVWCVTDIGAWISSDHGAKWNRSPLPEGASPSSISVGIKDPSLVLLGTREGRVYRTRDGGRSWDRLDGGLPAVPIDALVVNDTGSELEALAGTRGMGIFRLMGK